MTFTTSLRLVAGAVALLTLGACASTDPGEGFAAMDPYENTNRVFHDFNVGADRYVLRPAAKGYDAAVPDTAQLLIGNGISHLDLPVDLANYVLQGEVQAALRVLGRFTLNTTLGAGGLLDPATEFGLPREETDFGITLGKWGVASGPYLVLPLLGPSSPRDAAGFAVDIAFSPTTYTGFADSSVLNAFSLPLAVVERVDDRARNADLIDEVLYESPDSYVTLRSIYLQRRQAAILGEEGGEALPDIFDEEP
ncbi:MAG: VacJ family lipoprotein, partial [Pseudomonadota bacterium]